MNASDRNIGQIFPKDVIPALESFDIFNANNLLNVVEFVIYGNAENDVS